MEKQGKDEIGERTNGIRYRISGEAGEELSFREEKKKREVTRKEGEQIWMGRIC